MPLTSKDELLKLRTTILLARFAAYRAEIDHRSNRQLALISFNATAIAAIGSFVFVKEGGVKPLLFIPVISPLFGLSFLDHYLSIRRIGNFIQKPLNSAMHHIAGRELPDYEKYAHPLSHHHAWRFFIFALPLLMMFSIIPAGALLIAWHGTPKEQYDLAFWAGAGAGIFMLLLFLALWIPVVVRSSLLDPLTSVRVPPDLELAGLIDEPTEAAQVSAPYQSPGLGLRG